jgi:hypothetical protein
MRWPPLLLILTVLVMFAPGLPGANAADGDVPVGLSLTGPASVVDEHSISLQVTWTGADGTPVPGTVQLWQHVLDQAWQPAETLTLDATGRATALLRPRVDTWYEASGAAGPGWASAVTGAHYVDNLPPVTPVVLPAKAPRPAALPAQPRAVGAGAAVVIAAIPDDIWSSMVGRSWHAGCPVGRAGLRYLQTNYWGFDGYRHRGQLVVRASAAAKFTTALQRLYTARIRIRSMYLVDRFGYSARSGGANDFASMRADNTSAFNCRWVTGWRGVRSPHAYGRSIDIDPFENPFHSHAGWLPNTWWTRHTAPYAWRSSKHQVVRIMRSAGFRWSYPKSDPQHFDA